MKELIKFLEKQVDNEMKLDICIHNYRPTKLKAIAKKHKAKVNEHKTDFHDFKTVDLKFNEHEVTLFD